jgi:glycine cleavage system H lipoate-binding protein
MTVILILATFATFLFIDYLLSRKRAPQLAREMAEIPKPAHSDLPAQLSPVVAGFKLPENLRYHPGHTWALAESPQMVRVGIDDFAARLIGRASSVKLPLRGRWVRQGQTLMVVERDGAKAEIVSPMEGVVAGVNEKVLQNPELALRDPYGEGWLVTVQSPDAKTNFRNLLSGGVARKWLEDAAASLRSRIPVLATAVAQDGGVAIDDIGREMSSQEWSELAREMFLT